MNTLTSSRVADVLKRLFADAEKTTAVLQPAFNGVTPEERDDYRRLYARAEQIHMPVSPETGRLLYLLARTANATGIVEFGTSFGISTIHLAAALRDNGGGRLIGSDFIASKVAAARANLKEAGLDDLVEIREGDALETLARDLPSTVDLVLLDGHKPLYGRVLELIAPRLRNGACLVADNVDHSPDYVKLVRGAGFVSVPFSDGVEVSMKL
jgi:predicted O-methyltransferase YrrM